MYTEGIHRVPGTQWKLSNCSISALPKSRGSFAPICLKQIMLIAGNKNLTHTAPSLVNAVCFTLPTTILFRNQLKFYLFWFRFCPPPTDTLCITFWGHLSSPVTQMLYRYTSHFPGTWFLFQIPFLPNMNTTKYFVEYTHFIFVGLFTSGPPKGLFFTERGRKQTDEKCFNHSTHAIHILKQSLSKNDW